MGRAFTRCPGDRGNNPSCGFISPPLPRSISPHPLRSRSIFRVTLGLRNGGPRYGRCIVTPRYTPMPQTHQRQVRPTSLTSVQHFQHLQKKSQRKIARGGPRDRNAFPSATPPPGRPGARARRQLAKEWFPYSPVSLNDIKHLARSMPADGLEAPDVVPPRCGCWVAHIVIFSSRRSVFGQITHARARPLSLLCL